MYLHSCLWVFLTCSFASGAASRDPLLCSSLQGLPGPPGEKGENGDVGPMVSVSSLRDFSPFQRFTLSSRTTQRGGKLCWSSWSFGWWLSLATPPAAWQMFWKSVEDVLTQTFLLVKMLRSHVVRFYLLSFINISIQLNCNTNTLNIPQKHHHTAETWVYLCTTVGIGNSWIFALVQGAISEYYVLGSGLREYCQDVTYAQVTHRFSSQSQPPFLCTAGVIKQNKRRQSEKCLWR